MKRNKYTKGQVETSLDHLSQLGFIGGSPTMPTGERGWMITPRHQDMMLELLKHPERWGEIPALANRKAELHQLRNQAIAQGLISGSDK